MSSKPRHCLSFSFRSKSHISGSSWARLSWPVHGRSSSTVWVAAWDCCPRMLRRTGARWHSGCGQKFKDWRFSEGRGWDTGEEQGWIESISFMKMSVIVNLALVDCSLIRIGIYCLSLEQLVSSKQAQYVILPNSYYWNANYHSFNKKYLKPDRTGFLVLSK